MIHLIRTGKEKIMTAKLIAEEGALKELVLSFDEGEQWTIGRDPDACQFLVEDSAASRKHALCRKVPEGIIIENLSSSNPTSVNDEVITEPRLLQEGDTVKIGDTSFRYHLEPDANLAEVPSQSPDQGVGRSPENLQEEDEPDTILEGEEGGEDDLANVNFDLMDTGRWLLKVVGGPNSGAEFPLQADNRYIIGTDPNTCDIVFYDTSVSRQHLRITIQDDKLIIEDLKSRNGTRVEGNLLEEPRELPSNALVTAGTTSFVIYDREGEMQTIISPLLPSIVKVLQKEEPAPSGELAVPLVEVAKEVVQEAPLPPAEPPRQISGAFIVASIVIGLFVIVGLGISSLFMQAPPIVEQQMDVDTILQEAMTVFPGVKYSFNKTTGRLLLVGHILTATDRSQLLYNLQGLKFIKDIDDSGVIIDEYVWRETNQMLSDNPHWKSTTVYASTPGHFVLSGYLQSHDQAEQVWEYLARNFPYLDLLENKLVVEEDIITNVGVLLRNQSLNAVKVQVENGDVNLSGSIPSSRKDAYDEVLSKIKLLPGVRNVNNFITEAAGAAAVVNISDKYSVTGTSKADDGSLNVIINGRILSKNDILDGMKITKIQQDAVFLEKDDIIYQIDINR